MFRNWKVIIMTSNGPNRLFSTAPHAKRPNHLGYCNFEVAFTNALARVRGRPNIAQTSI